MKFSVSSYSYSGLTNAGKKTEAELIPLAAEMGFDAIEFAEIHTPAGMEKAEYAAFLRDEAKKAGIEIAAYCIGANLLDNTDAEIERLKGEVDIAAVLGVPVMRHDASGGYARETRGQRGFHNALPALVRGYKEVTVYAKTKGVRTCIENHGYFCQDSARVEAVINGVAHENFGALVDIGNFMCADEDPAVAVGNLAPYAFHVHCKDFHYKKGTELVPPDGFFGTRGGNWLRGAIIGHGVVPVAQCLRILKNAGYDGYYTVEFEGMEDPVKGVACGLNTLKKIETLL
ncbi:MAG: sugar phosphate isomerase/epimerase [Clostridia bacterium]|nr:sugar phosphate isomerase/epimerase [Clostridia bacterium]MBR5424533.1 sugar phosphate isomerase/epimerase [Clostridia bacterium]